MMVSVVETRRAPSLQFYLVNADLLKNTMLFTNIDDTFIRFFPEIFTCHISFRNRIVFKSNVFFCNGVILSIIFYHLRLYHLYKLYVS